MSDDREPAIPIFGGPAYQFCGADKTPRGEEVPADLRWWEDWRRWAGSTVRQTSPNPGVRPSRVAYQIIGHHDIEGIARLISASWDPANLYLIYMCGKCPAALLKRLGVLTTLRNVHIVHAHPQNWGYLLNGILEGMEFLLGAADTWDHYSLLTESDFPIRSQEAIRAALMEPGPDFNFIECNHKTVAIDAVEQQFHRLASLEPLDSENRYFGEHQKLFFNPSQQMNCLNFHVDTSVFGVPGWGFSMEPDERVLSDYHDVPEARAGFFRPLTPHVRRWMMAQPVLRNQTLFRGPFWVTISREFCEYAVWDPEALPIFEFFRHTFSPEEGFFHTLISNSRFRSKIVSRRNTYVDWHQEFLDESYLPKMKESQYSFCRKVGGAKSRPLIGALSESLAEGDTRRYLSVTWQVEAVEDFGVVRRLLGNNLPNEWQFRNFEGELLDTFTISAEQNGRNRFRSIALVDGGLELRRDSKETICFNRVFASGGRLHLIGEYFAPEFHRWWVMRLECDLREVLGSPQIPIDRTEQGRPNGATVLYSPFELLTMMPAHADYDDRVWQEMSFQAPLQEPVSLFELNGGVRAEFTQEGVPTCFDVTRVTFSRGRVSIQGARSALDQSARPLMGSNVQEARFDPLLLGLDEWEVRDGVSTRMKVRFALNGTFVDSVSGERGLWRFDSWNLYLFGAGYYKTIDLDLISLSSAGWTFTGSGQHDLRAEVFITMRGVKDVGVDGAPIAVTEWPCSAG
jgi:hypothetical protein